MHPGIHAANTPDKTAYIFARTGETVSYQELEADSNRIAHLLRSQNVKPGDGIVLLMENHPWFFKVIWAAQRSGLYYTPVSTRFQNAEVSYIVNNSDAKILFTSKKCLPLVKEIISELKAVEAVFVVDGENDEIQAQETGQLFKGKLMQLQSQLEAMPTTSIADEFEGAEMFYSSGTTGRPKGVRMPLPLAPLGTVTDIYKKRVELHKVHKNAIYLSPAPLYHSAPVRYNMMMMRNGATSVIMDKFDAEWALQLIEQYRVTHSQWVPTMFVRMLKLPVEVREKYDLTSTEIALHAAAPCPESVKASMLEWWGPVITEYYSGTEANGATNITPEEWLTHRGSVGRPIVGEVHILDDNGERLPAGERGMVYFSGGMDFQYYKDPEKTAEAKLGNGFSTLGDIGYVDEQGYLYLTDRKAYTIISGGVNIYPQEIEDLIISHPDVADVAVFGVPDEEFGEQVKAVVEPIAGKQASDELTASILKLCRDNLAHLKCPKSIDFEAQLPRHPTGKLYKRLLKEKYWPAN